MLHHISFSVADLKRCSQFYDALLTPLGYRRVFESKVFIGYGVEDNKDKFALRLHEEGVSPPSPGFHLAFAAPTRAAVEASYHAALKCGGRDNGAPGLRPHYGPNYFAAFLTDPDGYEVEAVINGE